MSNPIQNTPNNSIPGLVTYVSNFSGHLGYPITTYSMTTTSELLVKENDYLKKIISAKEEIQKLKEELDEKDAKIRVIEKNQNDEYLVGFTM